MSESGHDIIPVLMELSGEMHEHHVMTTALSNTGGEGVGVMAIERAFLMK